MFTYFVTTWQEIPYICNPLPFQKWCKQAVRRFAKTGYPSDGYFFASLFVYLLTYFRVQIYKLFPNAVIICGVLWLYLRLFKIKHG